MSRPADHASSARAFAFNNRPAATARREPRFANREPLMALEMVARSPRATMPWSARDWLAARLGIDSIELEIVDVTPEDDAATYRTPDSRVMVVVTTIDGAQRRVWCRIGDSTAEAFMSAVSRVSWA